MLKSKIIKKRPFYIKPSSYLESNFGRHIGVQFSECLKDSEDLTKLKIRCKSAGWMKYFFIRTRAIKRLSAINIANTKFFTFPQLCPITDEIVSRVADGKLRTRTADSINEGSVCIFTVKLSKSLSEPASIFLKS